MGNILKLEMQSCLWNKRFWSGVLLIVCAAVLAPREELKQLLEMGYSPEGPGWYAAFQFYVNDDAALMFIPLAVPLAAGSEAEEELRSRFAMFVSIRSGKKEYFAGKLFAMIISGGLMVCAAMLILLTAAGIGFHHVIWMEGIDHKAAAVMWEMLLYFLRGFLNGALWTMTGGAAALIMRNSYMAYAVPFVLYYVLFVFQERYWQNLFFLNPRYWASSLYYSSPVCIGILLVLSVCMAIVFCIALKRRVEHV